MPFPVGADLHEVRLAIVLGFGAVQSDNSSKTILADIVVGIGGARIDASGPKIG